ncbi:MAG: TlpA disulfide reductase family protein [Tepidisphaeraceae bacterium]
MSLSDLQKIATASANYDVALADYKKMIASAASDQTAKACQARVQETADAFIAAAFNDGQPGKESLANAVNGMVSDLPTQHDILNQPAPDWTANDLQGTPHSLKDFRGKVVLLDFGSRGCSWCMREIPQLIRLSQDFKDQPVAIIGMDLDTDSADAKFIVNAFRSSYLTLMASDAAKGYPVEGTPTVVIIDQNGIMRRRCIGYTTSGYYDMKAAIQSLLPTKAQALSD